MPLAAGTRLGPYEIVSPIGAGGMGEVYKARDTRLDRTVAIKVANERFSERFEREARAIAALNHPNICALYDVGPDYLVMEYIDGRPLKGPLAVEKALPLAIQMAEALVEAHEKGIVHRDLKPGNILLTKAGVKLLDFGLAKVAQVSDLQDSTVTETQVGTVLGTAAYMSPEQASGKPAGARSDIFSFGAVLYEMLSGQRAFQGETQYTTVAAILHQEPRPLDAPPELTALVARCLRKSPADRYQTAAELKTALAAVKPGEVAPSIAVLPFVNMSADKENEYFSDGLSEEIINALTKIPGLRVIARTSAFRFRGEQDLRKVGEALQVSNVLEGSVRKAQNRVRITAQLIKVANDSHVWSERYDRELTDIFAIQDEIAAAIVAQLKVSLSGKAPAKRPTASLAAYEAVLEGRHHWFKFTVATGAKALACFERAIALDPAYAEAHVCLALYYLQLAGLGITDPRAAEEKARAAAERALELDPGQAEALMALAQTAIWHDYDWAAAEQYFQRARALAPMLPQVANSYAALYLRPLGRLDEALAESERALALDPLSPFFRQTKAGVLMGLRQFEAGAETCQRALDLDPTYLLALVVQAFCRAYQHRFEEALALAEHAIGQHGRWATALAGLGVVQALAGNRDAAHGVIRELQEQDRTGSCAWHIFTIHAALGENDAAFEWAKRAIDQRYPTMTWIKAIPIYDSLRSDPRYPALLRKMNLS